MEKEAEKKRVQKEDAEEGVLAAAACATERGRRSEGRQAHEYLWGQHGIGAVQYEVLVPHLR